MKRSRPTYQDLEKRVAAAEPVVAALKHDEVDAVVGHEKISFLLLREVGEELRNSDAAFRAMFELSGVGMVQAVAPAFRFTRVNQRFCKIVGYSAEELLTKTYIDLTHPRDRQRDMKRLTRVLRGKTDSWCIEKRCIRKDGGFIWVSVNGTVLRNEAGHVVRMVVIFSDITVLKQAKQVLRDRSAEKSKSMRRKKAAAKKAPQSAGTKSSNKPRRKRR